MTEEEQDRVLDRLARDPGSVSLEEARQVVVGTRQDGTVVYLPDATIADLEERLQRLRTEQLCRSRN